MLERHLLIFLHFQLTENPLETPSHTELVQIVSNALQVSEEVMSIHCPNLPLFSVLNDISQIIYRLIVNHEVSACYFVMLCHSLQTLDCHTCQSSPLVVSVAPPNELFALIIYFVTFLIIIDSKPNKYLLHRLTISLLNISRLKYCGSVPHSFRV